MNGGKRDPGMKEQHVRMHHGVNEDGVSRSGKLEGWRKSKVWERIQGGGAGQAKRLPNSLGTISGPEIYSTQSTE